MATNPHQQHMSVEEYLELDRNSLDAKYEYIDGVVYNLREVQALAGGNIAHARIALNAAKLLDTLLAESAYQVYTSDVRVQVTALRYVYPDVTVSCEPTDWQGDILYGPRVVMEVLSPSTEAYDRGKKFAYYQQIPTLQEYVLISQQPQSIEHYTREDKHTWRYQLFGIGETVTLTSINITFDVAMLYERVAIPGNDEPEPPAM
jgi:Uma2 family endonuclease